MKSQGESRSGMEAYGFGVQEAAASLPFSPSPSALCLAGLQRPPGEAWREKSLRAAGPSLAGETGGALGGGSSPTPP